MTPDTEKAAGWREPRRIQRKRAKGWRMPEGAVYVGRPTRWGNPFPLTSGLTRDQVVRLYKGWLDVDPSGIPVRRRAERELRGSDLACWCPLGEPCHADVLLEVANADVR